MNTHDIFDFLSKQVGGDISYVVPIELKSRGTRPPPRPPPIYAHATSTNMQSCWLPSSGSFRVTKLPGN